MADPRFDSTPSPDELPASYGGNGLATSDSGGLTEYNSAVQSGGAPPAVVPKVCLSVFGVLMLACCALAADKPDVPLHSAAACCCMSSCLRIDDILLECVFVIIQGLHIGLTVCRCARCADEELSVFLRVRPL